MIYVIYQPLVLAQAGETPLIVFIFCLIIFQVYGCQENF